MRVSQEPALGLIRWGCEEAAGLCAQEEAKEIGDAVCRWFCDCRANRE
jgi:hypothetical protein